MGSKPKIDWQAVSDQYLANKTACKPNPTERLDNLLKSKGYEFVLHPESKIIPVTKDNQVIYVFKAKGRGRWVVKTHCELCIGDLVFIKQCLSILNGVAG